MALNKFSKCHLFHLGSLFFPFLNKHVYETKIHKTFIKSKSILGPAKYGQKA